MKPLRLLMFISIISLFSCSTLLYRTSGLDIEDYSIEKGILKLINTVRMEGRMCGNQYFEAVGPVVWNRKLAKVSLLHSIDMAKNGFLSHTGSDRTTPEERLIKEGYQFIYCGENIGQGYQTPKDAIKSWLRSKRHCRNIMNPDFKEIGAAFAKSKTLRTYWTLTFGTPKE